MTPDIQCEFIRLSQFKLEFTEDNLHAFLDIAEEYLNNPEAEALREQSAFVVEVLFKYGLISAADQVARQRQASGLAWTAFDRLATNYRMLEEYAFCAPIVHSHRPLYVSRRSDRKIRVLSFLYTTPVFQQNGYTVRTNSILTNTSLEVIPFGRIGYPWMSNLLRDSKKEHSARSGDIDYHHRRGEVTRQADVFTNMGLAKHEIKKIISELRPDIIHAASNFTVGLPAMLAARECRLPFVYEMRGIWELTAGVGVHGWEDSERFLLERRLETFVARSADRVITLTETQKDELVARGVESGRVHVVPNYYEPAEIQGESEFATGLRQKLAGKRVAGYIGSIVNYEGLQLLVEVLARRTTAFDDVALLIVGDGPYLDELKGLIVTKELTDKVLFTGRVPRADADAAYSLIDLCILPRLDHPVAQLVSPLKLIEILAKGKVLLVSDVRAMAERVEETGFGELFRSCDVNDLEKKMIELLANLDSYRERYSKASQYVIENHTWKRGVRLWDDAMLEALSEWRERAAAEGDRIEALDATRSLLPAGTENIRENLQPWRRVARASLFGAKIEFVVLVTPASVQALKAVLFDPQDHIGAVKDVSLLGRSTSEAHWIVAAAGQGERNLYLYILADQGEQARVPSWAIKTRSGKSIAITVEPNHILAVEIELKAGREEALLLRSEYAQAVRFVMSAIPLDGASIGETFRKKSFSEPIGAKFQYVTVEPGEKLIPVKFGVYGKTLIELTAWQEGLRGALPSVSAFAFCYGAARAQSYFLDLPADKHNVLVVARLNENLVDGSAIWLKTLARELARNTNVNVFVATIAILIPNTINALMFSAPNVVKLDLLLPADARDEALAAEVTLLDRISGGFDTLIVRSSGVAKALSTRSIRSRTVFYSVGLIAPDTATDGVYHDADSVALMQAYSALIFQNELTRDIFLNSCPSFQGRCYVIPPSVDPDDLASAAAPNVAADASAGRRTIVYAGKAIREYGVLELLEAVARLRETPSNADLRLVLIGSKFDGNDPGFQSEFHRLVAGLGDGVTWIPSASPSEVLGWVKRAQVVWGWRHGAFETSHFEVSTKMVEAICCGTPIILYPSPGNMDLVGADYEGFAATADEAAVLLVRLTGRSKRDFARRFAAIGAGFTSDRTYRPLTTTLITPNRRKHILIAAHDFKFVEDIEANLLRDGHRVHRQIWYNHTDVHDYGDARAAADADIIHCEWCLGNAVWWSNNLPDGKLLTIRFHRQELVTEHPHHVDYSRVYKIMFISPYVMRQAINTFSIPSDKCVVIPISVALHPKVFSHEEMLARRNVMALVGFTPWLKRPDLALSLFLRLKTRYPDLRLLLKGHMPSKHAWMKNRTDEIQNYQAFFRKAAAHAETGDVEFLGHDNNMQGLYERAGWILSTSDIEGCHTAVAEGGILGCMPLMLNWAGADEVYPPRYVASNLDGLEANFDAWYANFEVESAAIQRRFSEEFTLDRVYARWTDLLGLDTKPMAAASKPLLGSHLADALPRQRLASARFSRIPPKPSTSDVIELSFFDESRR